ncbi:MAG: N-acetylmuramic acid 6-phosphate etherase [Bacteroidales bacterium]|nr:N-acetylmuramic acid 6-phosphate etherase [Bacteroidales bacterium]
MSEFNNSSKATTEQESLHNDLEKKTFSEILIAMNDEDKKVALAVEKAIPAIDELVSKALPRMQNGGRLFYIGAGTSGRLGVLDASEIPPTYGMEPGKVVGVIAGGDWALRNAAENAEDNYDQAWVDLKEHDINEKDTIVGIAASGRTPYVIGGLTEGRAIGCLTGAVSMNPGSKIAEAAEIAMEAVVGPEFVTGSTRMKSGTAQKLILNMISTALMIKLGKVKGNRMVDMQLTNEKLVDRGTRMIMLEVPELSYEKAEQLLLEHGSVRAGAEAYKKELRNI